MRGEMGGGTVHCTMTSKGVPYWSQMLYLLILFEQVRRMSSLFFN